MKSPFKLTTNEISLELTQPTPFVYVAWIVATACFCWLTSAAPAQQPATGLTDTQLNEGWISLFDGQTTFGWKPTSEANWKVVDGTITVDSGPRGFLRTTTQYADFELRLEFKAQAETNSGVFIRTSPQPKNPAAECYEINIAPNSNPFPTGGIVGRHKGKPIKPLDESAWHELHIMAKGDMITVTVNGELISEYKDPKPLGRGFISLQLNEGPVAFRNIYLRPLELDSIFDGKSLDQWTEYPDMESKFSVTDDAELHVENGRGQLETKTSFGDFVLQLECRTNAAELNSGIFFRCIPGDTMMGYESQIQNGFKEQDRTQPADCGTGGIFRRANARKIVANDLEWFTKTIIAEGPHIAVWVNGYQVTDWTDTRKPHENPRKGLRKAAGTIMIQGHDPTTDILFRNLRAAEMSPRR